MNPPVLTAAGLTAIALAVAGCTTPSPPTQKGELTEGTFTYKCAGSSDAFCDDGFTPPEGFPKVALNSEFSVDFTPEVATNDDGTPVFSFIDTVAPERIEVVGDLEANPPTLSARVAGFSALIAKGDYGAFDFLTVEVVPIETIEVAVIGAGSNVTGTVGLDDFTINGASSTKFRSTLRMAGGDLLAGSLPCAWSSTNSSVAAITTSSTDNLVTVEAKSAGKATLTVTMSEFQVQFPITVTMP